MGILFTFEAVRMKDVGIGETTIGILLAISSALFIFSSLFWGNLADRKHCHKKIITIGSVLFSGLLLYFSFCETPLQFLIYVIVRSTLMPMVNGIMPALAIASMGGKRSGAQFGVYRAFGSLGFMCGTMILPLLLNDIGLVARVASIILLASVFLIRKLPEPEAKKSLGTPLRLKGINPLITLFLVSFFFIATAEPALHGFFHAYARELGGSTRLLGILGGVMGMVAFTFLPLMGRIIDHTTPALILAISFFAQPLRVYLTSLITDPNFLWLPILLHGITWGGVEVSAIVYLSSLVKEDQKATILSFYMATRMLGHLTGSGISGYLAENFGYTSMFQTIAAIALTGAIIYSIGSLVLRKKREQAF
ncbi:MFS transporter [Puniceicoccaceae bacterium K14]|nr:MFS transporter [Puniceicoccaceae bacterium K14]